MKRTREFTSSSDTEERFMVNTSFISECSSTQTTNLRASWVASGHSKSRQKYEQNRESPAILGGRSSLDETDLGSRGNPSHHSDETPRSSTLSTRLEERRVEYAQQRERKRNMCRGTAHSPYTNDSISSTDSNMYTSPTTREGMYTLEAKKQMQESHSSFISVLSKPANGPSEARIKVEDKMHDFACREVYFNYDPGNAAYRHRSNAMRSYRYTIITAVPLILYQIFTKASNVYFFFICVVQAISQVSSLGYPPSFPAFLLVLLLEFVLAIAQDVRRWKCCQQVNRMVTHILRNKSFQDVLWCDVRAGDFIQVRNAEMVPADILLLGVSDPIGDGEGVCYVETRHLDGACSRKARRALPSTTGVIYQAADLLRLRGVARYNTSSIRDTFGGSADVSMETSQEMQHTPFSLQNVLLRGYILRDTEYVYGLVLGTGADTKLLRSTGQRWKRSELITLLDKVVGILCLYMVVSCAIAAALALAWSSNERRVSPWYLFNFVAIGDSFIRTYLHFLLSCYPIVPVSVCVAVSSVKLLQAMYIKWDAQSYAKDSNIALGAQNLESHEQLGRISDLFTDKAGTLTQNCLRFRRCSINGISYGSDLSKEGALSPQSDENESFMDLLRLQKYGNCDVHAAERQRISQFFEHVAICHNITSDAFMKERKGSNWTSCDDEALLVGAASIEYIFESQSDKHITLRVSGVNQTFEILHQYEDMNCRGRFSVAVRRPNGDLYLYTKGSGSQMYPRLRKSDRLERLKVLTQQHVNEYTKEGLRTLVLTVKKLDEASFIRWQKSYILARNQTPTVRKSKERQTKLDSIINELESDLELIGAIGVEDKLQAKVPECIQSLTEAGIRIWMLTGDNEEMALSAGYASTILNSSTQQIVLTSSTCGDGAGMEALLQEAANSQDDETQIAIITDGKVLNSIIERQLMSAFLDIAIQCRVIIAAGMSSAQKGKLVRLVRQNLKGARTLAIGNGSSDIAMVLAADVGASIVSNDSLQTGALSDYTIPEFHFLQKLLLVHGRWNYLRLSKAVHYILYANFTLFSVMYLQSLLWGFYNASVHWENSIHLYSTLFTNFPILMVAILDQELPASALMEHPSLYRNFVSQNLISISTCLRWLGAAVYDAVIIVIFISIGSESSHSRLETEMYVILLVILIVNAKICFLVSTWTLLLLGCWALSMVFWLIVASSGAQIPFSMSSNVHNEGFGAPWLVMSWSQILGLILALSIALVSGITWNHCKSSFHLGIHPGIPQASTKLSMKTRRLSVPELEEHTVSMSLDHVSALYRSTESPQQIPNTSAHCFSDVVVPVEQQNRAKSGSRGITRGRVASTIHEHVEKRSESTDQFTRAVRKKHDGKNLSASRAEGSESDQLEQSFSVSVYSSSIAPTSSAFEKLSGSQVSKRSSYPYRNSPFSCEEDTMLTESYVFSSRSKHV